LIADCGSGISDLTEIPNPLRDIREIRGRNTATNFTNVTMHLVNAPHAIERQVFEPQMAEHWLSCLCFNG